MSYFDVLHVLSQITVEQKLKQVFVKRYEHYSIQTRGPETLQGLTMKYNSPLIQYHSQLCYVVFTIATCISIIYSYFSCCILMWLYFEFLVNCLPKISRAAPFWPHEPCYQGSVLGFLSLTSKPSLLRQLMTLRKGPLSAS